MKKNGFISSLWQQTRRPSGFWGRCMLLGMNVGHAALARWACRAVGWQPGWRVLDVGCGGGANLARLLRCCPSGQVYGVDFAPESVAFSRRKMRARLGKDCFMEQAAAASLPFAADTFDAVTAFETVYFWDAPQRCFEEVRRVLKPGGIFLISCEAADPSDDTWTRRVAGMHVYGPVELTSLLTEAGFAVERADRDRRGALRLVARKAQQPGKEVSHGSHQ